ncbi:MAG: enoyl-CoA hydratase/isomerase family protein, partial [Reyranella sp.]|nr:enoyl-CoA hydratase/isomerase family protein [Reyranella sp.]
AQPEIALDHLPGGGGTQRLPRLVPLSFAYEHLLLGEPIPAVDAYRAGLVSHVWPDEELLDRAVELARRIARRGPVAVRYTMEAVRIGLQGPLDSGMRLERAMASLVNESREAKEGMRAFFESGRRPARK